MTKEEIKFNFKLHMLIEQGKTKEAIVELLAKRYNVYVEFLSRSTAASYCLLEASQVCTYNKTISIGFYRKENRNERMLISFLHELGHILCKKNTELHAWQKAFELAQKHHINFS